MSKAIRTDNYVFIEKPQNKGKIIRKTLYNRQDDPREKKDTALSCPEVAGRLERQLNEQIDDCSKLSGHYSSNEAGPLGPEDREKLKSLGYL